ncbi:MAG: hypothetical protein JJU16_08530 [Alkalibacterium sp.]|nr:hypothetical protein [Alkalibacterium sp.]
MNTILSLLDLIYDASYLIMPIFIVLLVFNSGISEHPKTIFETIKTNWGYFLRLVLFNNIALPVLLWVLLQFIPIDPVYTIGFVILFLCAGASTVIAFVQSTQNKITYAVTTMILLTLSTVVILPILLPLMIDGAEITSSELVGSLVASIVIPLAVGSALRLFIEDVAIKIKPFTLKTQKILMNIAVYGMMLGLFPELVQLVGSGVITTSIVIILSSAFVGYMIEMKNPDKAMQLTSLFAAGQRNGAVAFAVVINNFADPTIFLTIAITTMISTVLFSAVSSYMGKLSLKKA